MNGRMTARVGADRQQALAAAMEPAYGRPGDPCRRVAPANVTNTIDIELQWSRPASGRMTSTSRLVLNRSPWPQWSRPVNGRMTIGPLTTDRFVQPLQWADRVDGRMAVDHSQQQRRVLPAQRSRPINGSELRRRAVARGAPSLLWSRPMTAG